MGNSITCSMYHRLQPQNISNTLYPRNMVGVRYVNVNNLHKREDNYDNYDYDDEDNNNNNNNK